MDNIKLLMGLIIYKIAPMKKNRFVFTSFNGHYSDNSRYISEKLHELYPDSDIIWLLLPKYRNNVPSYIKTKDISSLGSFWYRGTAEYQIDNVYGFSANFKTSKSIAYTMKYNLINFLKTKKKRRIYATMHGTPVKKIGGDQVGNCIYDMFCDNTELLVADNLTKEVLDRVTFHKIPIHVVGSPRNDVLASDNSEAKMNFIGTKKVILFAPTFRNDGKDVDNKNVYRSGLNQLALMDFNRLFEVLSTKFGGDWVMICRFHYHVADMVDWNKLNTEYPGKFLNGNEIDDMSDYLKISDILITDSSSCMHDFSVTYKPCFLFFPDLDNYRDKERGFYIDLDKLPFKVSKDFDGLIDSIVKFDSEEYKSGVDLFFERIGRTNDNRSSERVVNYIKKNKG